MTNEEVRARIEEIGIIPALRVYSAGDALFAAEAVSDGGIPIVEITMTVPGAVDVIRELVLERKGMIVGAGTVLDEETAHRCLDAGASFVTTPGLDLDIVKVARERKTAIFPGALTPSEVMMAWKAGCDLVKVFPCAHLGGAPYIRTLKAPFPHIPLIAGGGVNQRTAADYILAGASALGIGQDLIHQDAISRREGGWIRELARRYLGMVQDARSQRTPHRDKGSLP